MIFYFQVKHVRYLLRSKWRLKKIKIKTTPTKKKKKTNRRTSIISTTGIYMSRLSCLWECTFRVTRMSKKNLFSKSETVVTYNLNAKRKKTNTKTKLKDSFYLIPGNYITHTTYLEKKKKKKTVSTTINRFMFEP